MTTRSTTFLRACRRRMLIMKPHLPAIGFVALLCAPHVIELPGGHSVIGSVAGDLARLLGFALQQRLVGRSRPGSREVERCARTMGQETATRKQDAADRAGR